jgi:hypothetical protein
LEPAERAASRACWALALLLFAIANSLVASLVVAAYTPNWSRYSAVARASSIPST